MWTKLDDSMPEHPKIHALGDDVANAMWLWQSCAAYSARFLLDGFIPESAAVAVGLAPEDVRRAKAALCRVVLWEREVGGYRMHNYARYNMTRTQKEQRSEAGKVGAEARWGAGVAASDAPPTPTTTDQTPHGERAPAPAAGGSLRSND